MMAGKNQNDGDEVLSQRSLSNETLPLNEDPMNLVETSWDISGTIGKTTSTSSLVRTNQNGQANAQQASISIKN